MTIVARKPRYLTLDAMRGVAALAVVMYHGSTFFGPKYTPSSAYLAVDMFFILSGFVIALNYEDKLRGGMRFTDFTAIRVIRLYPLFFLGLTLAFLAMSAMGAVGRHGAENWRSLLPSYLVETLMLPSHVVGQGDNLFRIDPPLWSLFYELLINLVYACFLYRLNWKLLVAIVSICAIGLAFIAHGPLGLTRGVNWYEIPQGVCRTTFGFTTGVLLYRLRIRQISEPKVPALIILASTCLVLAWSPSLSARPWFEMCSALLFMPALVYLGTCSIMGPRLSSIGDLLGISSYPVYVCHAGLLLVSLGIAARVYPPMRAGPAPLVGVLFLAMLVAAALLIHHVYDVPVRRWLSSLFKERMSAK